MLSRELHEAVKVGYVDLHQKKPIDVYQGRGLGAEEKALATALVKTGKAFIKDTDGVADESAIVNMIHRGLARVSEPYAAAFSEYMRIADGSVPSEVARNLVIRRVKGKTGDGWKIVANLNALSEALAWNALARALSKTRLPIRRNGTESRKVPPSEFQLMYPLPTEAAGQRGMEWQWGFKHSGTRNYLFVNPESGTIYVPSTGKPFERGEFG